MQDDSEKLTASQIGDLGEMTFRALCLQQGLHCSTIEPDRTGKDFLVEWPPGSSGGHSYDTRHPPKRCIVQIKATGSSTPSARLKLSAAEWLVNDNMPAFVVCPVFDGISPTHLLVFHVRGGVLQAILRRLREAQRDGELLSQVTVSLPAAEGVSLAVDGKSLQQHLENQIGDSALSYSQAKEQERVKAGFDDAFPISMKVTFEVTDPSHVVECLLGERQLDAKFGPAEETRFDIALPAPAASFPSGPVKLSVDPAPTHKWSLSAVDAEGSEIVAIDVEGKTAAMAGLPIEYWRAEFSNGFVSVRFRETQLNVSFGGSEVWEKEVPLSVIRSSIRFWRALIVDGARMSITRAPGSAAAVVKPAPEDEAHHEKWSREILALLDQAAEFFTFCGDPDPVTTVKAIWENRRDLKMALRKISYAQEAEAPITFSVEPSPDLMEIHDDPAKRMLLYTTPIVMWPAIYAIAVSYRMDLVRADGLVQAKSLARFPAAGIRLSSDDPFKAYDAFIERMRAQVKPTFHAYTELLPVNEQT